jgi:hypothetical protein
LLLSVKEAIESTLGKTFESMTALLFIRQIVAGTNYCMKVKAGDEHFHVKIFVPLPHTGQPPKLGDIKPASEEEELVSL